MKLIKIILKNKKILLFVILMILTTYFAIYFSVGNLKATHLPGLEKIPYDREAFVDINSFETLDTNKLVAETSELALYFNEETTHFKLVHKKNGAVWYSNPPIEEDPFGPILDIQNRQKATLAISYVVETGVETTITNYEYSIQHPTDFREDQTLKSYYLRYLDNAVQILYIIESQTIDKSYFPRYLTQKRFQEILDRLADDPRNQQRLQNYYSLVDPIVDNEKGLHVIDPDDPDPDHPTVKIYTLPNYDNLAAAQIERLYEIFYEKAGYTTEELEADNAMFQVKTEIYKPYFEIAIEYRLTESGLRVSIIRDSIVETTKFQLTKIQLLPYFGAADTTKEGYFVIPDGSGFIVHFNNNKQHLPVYEKRFYGPDLAMQPLIKPEQVQDLMFPIYGIVDTTQSSAMLAIIEQGASLASLRASVSLVNDSFNKIHTTFRYRELETFYLYNAGRSFDVPTWTKDIIDTDIVVEYRFLADDQANYFGLAQAYRDYLITTKGLQKIDRTTETVVNITMLGLFDKREHFLGIPYKATRSLTSFEQAQLILDELREEGITQLNVIYDGWFNGSMNHSIPLDFKINRAIGGQSALRSLIQYLDQYKMPFYPSVNLSKTPKYKKMFDQYRYTAKHVHGQSSRLYDYNLATKLIDESRGFDYLISPKFYQSLIEKMLEKYNAFGIDGLTVNDLGNQLAGDYSKNYYIFRYQSEQYQILALERLASEKKLSIAMPYAYALPYVSNILESPIDTTRYPIVDEAIPFYQLVLNGYIDYAGISINQNSEKGLNYHRLKAIETGANLHFIFSYEDSSILLDTDFNHYYATNYRNWMDDLIALVNELNSLGIHEAVITNHEIITHGVYKVEYSNGKTFILNYNLVAYVDTDRQITVPPESYVLIGGDEYDA